MWIHLRRLGAPRGRRPNKHMVPIGGLGDNRFIRSPDEDSKPVFNTRSVVAALIATVTFTAALAMPGGYDSSGEANLVKKPALWAFILSDALAMCCSIAVLFLLLGAMVVERDLQTILNNASVSLLSIAILATLAAFMSGIFAIIAPKALWVAILACIVCSMVLYLSRSPIVVRYPLSTWFMPSIITRDILRLIHLKQQRNKIKRDWRYVVLLIRRGSPDTTYCVSNNNTVNSYLVLETSSIKG
ncbi:hypothetical protein Vadar_022064 [Vaccinium darrowii]|uniref:Uncharacterized protein n=1 Tax=Vaccinium darrowii TaxID=229202 RepID=A0ACB7XSX9_9ERIC|nr:hypothetical protein Vadar_022064 [Vaccinium darrowii]